ncbi:hypothetical protein [Sorangium atrum]|uniref:Uncharacterized protein n=1 Tax=Sorangium atrum TaxID=2995308 RepID=A0ABT5CB09_9BACT|nr:hypothetical protein [Sorangium aterium]MDC0683626.1 hypothetical protein [Sorangium aterium]
MAPRGGSLTLLLRGADANLSGTDGEHGQLVMQRASEVSVEDASKDASDGTAGASEGAFDAVSGVGARPVSPPFEGLCEAFAAWYELC